MPQLSSNTINILHIVAIAPLFYTLGTNQFPNEYKQYLVHLAVILVLYHAYKLYKRNIY